MKWLMGFLVERYGAAPARLNVQIPQRGDSPFVYPLEAEADERCSFVGIKANKRWLWLALEARSRQVLTFHVGEKQPQERAAVMEQVAGGLSRARDVSHGCLCALRPGHPPGASTE